MIFEIRGDTTGRVWRYHPTVDRVESSGERYMATDDDGSLACLHRCEKDGYWDDEIDRLRVALAIARLPAVAATPEIRQLIDMHETESAETTFGIIRGLLVAIWEWADISLDDFLHEPDDRPATVVEAVDANVRCALDVLHGAGWVHLDVAPNNILRVDGVWKLADLDSCAERGQLTSRGPIARRYMHPDRRSGHPVPAREEFDFYGLEQVISEIRSR